MFLRRSIIFFSVLMNFISSCRNAEFKGSYTSLSMEESINRKVFVCRYDIKVTITPDSLNFNVKDVWLEKNWSNYLDKDGHERISVSDSAFHLVMNFYDLHVFENNNYWSNMVISDSNDNSIGSVSGVLFLD